MDSIQFDYWQQILCGAVASHCHRETFELSTKEIYFFLYLVACGGQFLELVKSFDVMESQLKHDGIKTGEPFGRKLA